MLKRFVPLRRSSEDPAEIVEHRDLAVAIDGAMAHLPPIRRSVLEFAIAGMPARRIAQCVRERGERRTGVSWVRSIIHRARVQLHRMLDPLL